MFIRSLLKTAATLVTMTPDEFYEDVHHKDKYVGAITGNLAGMGHRAHKAAKGTKSKAALIGALAGTAAGGVAGEIGGRALRNYQANKVYRLADELNLRSTPQRNRHGG